MINYNFFIKKYLDKKNFYVHYSVAKFPSENSSRTK